MKLGIGWGVGSTSRGSNWQLGGVRLQLGAGGVDGEADTAAAGSNIDAGRESVISPCFRVAKYPDQTLQGEFLLIQPKKYLANSDCGYLIYNNSAT